MLVAGLRGHGLSVDQVTHVFVSHHHIDHTRNIGMFRDAVVIDSDSVYTADRWAGHVGDGYEIADGVTLMLTPGHSAECASMVVRTQDKGTVVRTHAWWFSDMTPVVDPLAADQEALAASRARILGIADLVVPGHGEPFAVSK